MSANFLESIVSKARELGPKPLAIKEIKSEASGIKLLGQLETHLVTQGFTFRDIEGDKHNLSCLKSRMGKKLLVGKHGVVVCLRMFKRADGSISFFVQVQ